ncbi:MAG: outer-membrane lipoprotein carrier protein LolA, partial [Mesorhizobium sp.]
MKNQISGAIARLGMARRKVSRLGLATLGALVLAVATPTLQPVSKAEAASDAARKIADHFSSIRTMSGDFVQFGPRGEQTGGQFYIARPGKVRFNYEAPSAYRVISDGKSVVIVNKKLRT